MTGRLLKDWDMSQQVRQTHRGACSWHSRTLQSSSYVGIPYSPVPRNCCLIIRLGIGAAYAKIKVMIIRSFNEAQNSTHLRGCAGTVLR